MAMRFLCNTLTTVVGVFVYFVIYFLIIIVMTREITIDDVIEFIIRHCDDTELMDKINKTSFPFTTKYLNSNKRNSTPTTTITYPPCGGSTFTLCGNEDKK
jgi:hypothetical protein